ncbi:MAG: hypothetical protein NTW32_19340 [Chloroflexi bacterium]|nr:hypothetical protein [Chloroflexota bacterium]
MRIWNLVPGDPLQLTIAADARFTIPDYINDHIWDLDLSGGDPSAVALRTTFGLRARLMRIFPRFTENGKAINDPAEFAIPPHVRAFYPNFLSITFSPYPGVDVTADYWVVSSQVASGRFTVTNHSLIHHPIRFELVGQLIPLDGQNMTTNQRQSVTTLEGQIDDLRPVLFLTGGPQAGPGPYSSLALILDLAPGASRQVTWALATLKDAQSSFELARKTVARPFDAEKALIELLNASETVEIYTGDPDWDATLAFTQKNAFSLLMGPSEHLPHSSFVLSRQPDQGYSRLGDGSDYQHFWNGQPALEAYYLSTLLPAAPKYMRGVLQNYLSVQDTHNGTIDCKPGLAGQRGRFLAAPYLASLVWRLAQAGRDKEFIISVYPALLAFFWSWFSPARDHDHNGLPEWQHPTQTGFDENPLFDGWHTWAKGINITTVQSPALSAALFREAECLMKMADLLGRSSDIITLKAQSETLRQGVHACWDADNVLFRYADRDTHLSLPGKLVSERQAAHEFTLQKEFKQPVRLVIRILGKDEALKRPHVIITGKLNGDEQTEILNTRDFTYSSSGAVATSEKVYTSLGSFEFDGLSHQDRINIQTVDLTIADHTLLLPLWAGIPSKHEAHSLIYQTILDANQFDHPYGIPALPRLFIKEADPVSNSVHLPWNHLIGEGLLAYGYRREAVRLTAHITSAVIQNLKRSQAFYRTYHAETGAGLGERNTLQGLAPLGLFLSALGVEIQSPTRVILTGENLFPWPVTVKYRGLTVTRLMGQTEVIFPNGQPITLNDPTNAVIACE